MNIVDGALHLYLLHVPCSLYTHASKPFHSTITCATKEQPSAEGSSLAGWPIPLINGMRAHNSMNCVLNSLRSTEQKQQQQHLFPVLPTHRLTLKTHIPAPCKHAYLSVQGAVQHRRQQPGRMADPDNPSDGMRGKALCQVVNCHVGWCTDQQAGATLELLKDSLARGMGGEEGRWSGFHHIPLNTTR